MAKYQMPPRQKMINLVYVILIAMLGINISRDALEGYDIMNKDYQLQITELINNNHMLKEKLSNDTIAVQTVDKIDKWTSTLEVQLDSLTEQIAQNADEKNYKKGKLKNREEMNAVSLTMLSTSNSGTKLKTALNEYKTFIIGLLNDEKQQKLINSYLNSQDTSYKSWEETTFSGMTANAGITFLAKLKKELLTCEYEALKAIFEPPTTPQEAEEKISTENQVYVNGMIVEVQENGTLEEPVAAIEPEWTATLYRHIENRLNITYTGIPSEWLNVQMTNGTIKKSGLNYVAIPNEGSKHASILITNKSNGKLLAQYNYFIKDIPKPTAYVAYIENGKTALYKGDVPIAKEQIRRMEGVYIENPEGLPITYKVLNFETVVIKNETNEVTCLKSQGHKLSEEQKVLIGGLNKGDKCYITSINVSSPNKKSMQIASINVVVI